MVSWGVQQSPVPHCRQYKPPEITQKCILCNVKKTGTHMYIHGKTTRADRNWKLILVR
jgi:hypothetical protein